MLREAVPLLRSKEARSAGQSELLGRLPRTRAEVMPPLSPMAARLMARLAVRFLLPMPASAFSLQLVTRLLLQILALQAAREVRFSLLPMEAEARTLRAGGRA